MERNIYKIGKELFITNDEEIKEGIDQWYLDKVLNEPYNSGGAQYSSKQDKLLIKDGVQAIDDEFLEWFINHSNCKQIEIKKGFEDETEYGYNFLDYKIIIPK